MPTGNLPAAGSLGDPQVDTTNFQNQINELLAYALSLKAEVDALPDTQIKKGAVTDVGTALDALVTNAQLNTRLGIAGNLGVQTATVALGGDFTSGTIKIVRVADMVTFTLQENRAEHASSSAIYSDPGVLPSWARIKSGSLIRQILYDQTKVNSSVGTAEMMIQDSGRIALIYKDVNGSPLNKTNSYVAFTCSYTVPATA